MAFVELNHMLEDGMPVYPGFPEPRFEAILDHEASRPRYRGRAEFYLGKVEMPSNLGTYLDSPFHRFPDRPDLSALPLESVAGLPGLVVDASPAVGRAVGLGGVDERDLTGRAVLFRTGWDRRWGTEAYWELGPYLAAETIDALMRDRAALVGVDFWNVDDTEDPSRPAHTGLLAAGIPIVEHLANLGALPRDGFRFYAVPPRLVRGANFTVRAFAEV